MVFGSPEWLEQEKTRQLEEWNITEAELPAFNALATQVNEELGGSYVGGALTPPASWTGSVTEWARHARQVALERFQQGRVTPPITPPVTPPVEPTPTPSGLFVCPYDGQRFDTQAELATHLTAQHAALPGGVAGAGAGLGVTQTTGIDQNIGIGGTEMTMGIEGAYGPYAQYARRMGIGVGYQTPAQTYQRGLYDPMRGLFEMQQPYGAAMGIQTPYWGDFMGQYAGQPRSVYEQYGTLLGGLFGMTPEARQTFGMGFEPQYGEFGGRLTAAQTGQRPLSELQSLITGGLIPQIGPGGAGWLGQRVPFMREQWEVQQPEMTFIDYIKEKYNLGQYF